MAGARTVAAPIVSRENHTADPYTNIWYMEGQQACIQVTTPHHTTPVVCGENHRAQINHNQRHIEHCTTGDAPQYPLEVAFISMCTHVHVH